MNIQSTRPISLPKLPEIPKTGTGTHVTEPIDYLAPDTVETRLGSIPKDYEPAAFSLKTVREKPPTDTAEAEKFGVPSRSSVKTVKSR